MDLTIDTRYFLLSIAQLIFPFSQLASAIFTLFLLFVSIKVPFTLQLQHNGSLIRIRVRDLSVSVIVSTLCLIFMSAQDFWIVNLILFLCSCPWDDFILKLLKWCFRLLYQILEAIPILEFLCILNNHCEAMIDEEEELSFEANDHVVVVVIPDQCLSTPRNTTNGDYNDDCDSLDDDYVEPEDREGHKKIEHNEEDED